MSFMLVAPSAIAADECRQVIAASQALFRQGSSLRWMSGPWRPARAEIPSVDVYIHGAEGHRCGGQAKSG